MLESSLTGTSFASRFAALLHENELFGTLTEQEMSRLAPFCAPFVAIEEAVLFAESRQASHLYLVTEVRIALQKRSVHGTGRTHAARRSPFATLGT